MKITVFIISISIIINLCQTQTDNIKLLLVFSRHGARTPELKDVYPNDPYKLENFLPMGYGQLTEQGKWQAYKVGELLRTRYESFIGNISNAEMVHVLTTDYDRIRNSASRILAGLFSKSPSQKDFPSLIPINFKTAAFDFILQRPNSYCPAYLKELTTILESKNVKEYLEVRKDFFEYLSKNTGKPIKKLQDVFDLYQTLTAEKTMNLTLPEWTKKVYPKEITEVAVKQIQLENSTPLLKKLNGGRSLEIVLKNMLAANENRKLFLYAGHENNINNLLYAMGIEQPIFPNYSATIVFELHFIETSKEYAVKILHMNGPENDFLLKQLPGCEALCSLKKFQESTKPVVPVNFTAECESTKNLDP